MVSFIDEWRASALRGYGVRSVVYAAALVLLLVAGVAFGLAVAERRRVRATGWDKGLQSIFLRVALVASVAAILVLTLFPIDDDKEVQFLPLSDIVETLTPPVDETRLLAETANILLFVPFGAVLGLLGSRIGKTAVIAFALSAAVESAQLLVSGRTTSVDDLLLNTLGAVLGHAVLSRCLPVREASPSRR
jgi:glycopeptide antibiotics resistance protein